MTEVLIVEDETALAEPLAFLLQREGFEVRMAADGQEALAEFSKAEPDIVLLDLMLPGMSGTEVCKNIRLKSSVPVIMVTARDTEIDKVVGLEIGADDYVTKPFSLEEVITRLRVILRRGNVMEDEKGDGTLRYADLTLNDETHEVTKAGKIVDLSPTEFNLLRYLMLNAEVVVSKAKILDNVWHYDFGGDGNVVESYISYLRRKVDQGEQQLIHTVRGVGYVLRTPRQ